jgi:hypothetical protein
MISVHAVHIATIQKVNSPYSSNALTRDTLQLYPRLNLKIKQCGKVTRTLV